FKLPTFADKVKSSCASACCTAAMSTNVAIAIHAVLRERVFFGCVRLSIQQRSQILCKRRPCKQVVTQTNGYNCCRALIAKYLLMVLMVRFSGGVKMVCMP